MTFSYAEFLLEKRNAFSKCKNVGWEKNLIFLLIFFSHFIFISIFQLLSLKHRYGKISEQGRKTVSNYSLFLLIFVFFTNFSPVTLGKYSPSPVSLTGFWSYVNATKRMKSYLSALFYTQIYRRSYGTSTVLLFQMVWWRNSAVTTVVTVYKFDTDVDCWLTVKTHCGSIKDWMLLPSPSD